MADTEPTRAEGNDGAAYLRRAARGGLWLGIGRAIGSASTWLATLVLARLLVPADFGLVAMATVILGFVNAFADLGLTAALIQRRELEPPHRDAAFMSSLSLGVLLYGLAWVLAPALAEFYGEPRVAMVLRVAALSLVLSPFWTTHAALLRRGLYFGSVAKVELARNVVHGVTSVAGAAAGHGYWAIIAGPLAGHLAAVVGYRFANVGWSPGLSGTRTHARELYGFSMFVAGTSVVNYLNANVDYLIVGRTLGAAELGIYTLGYQMMTFPLSQISALFSQTMFPAFSALQGQLEQMRQAYLNMTRAVAAISFPIMAAMAVMAPELVRVAYGAQWLDAVPILRILIVAGAIKSVGSLVGIVYRALGKGRAELYWNLVYTVAITLAVLIGVRWGSHGVAWAIALLALPSVLYTEWLACKYLELGFTRLLGRVVLPTVSTLVAAAAGFFVRGLLDPHWTQSTVPHAAARMLVLTACVLLAYVACLRALSPTIGAEARAFVNHFRRQR